MSNRAGKIFNTSRKLYLKKVPLIPKLLRTVNRVVFTCDIPYQAEIDKTVRFSHNGLGIVVSENARIGKNTRILQHVTIGGNGGKKKEIDDKVTTAPVIGENVLIGAGAKILGPVKIGDNAKIGAGAVVTIDVPENGVAVGIPARLLEAKEKVTV